MYLISSKTRPRPYMTFIVSNFDFTNPWKIKDIYVPHALENSWMMFDPQNYECLIPSEQRLFHGHFGIRHS